MKVGKVILITASVAGVIGAVASAIYEAPQAKKALAEYKLKKQNEKKDEIIKKSKEVVEDKKETVLSIAVDSVKELASKAKVVVPRFWRTGAFMLVAIGSEMLFFKITTGELVALTSTVGYLVTDRKNIEKNIVNVVGEDKYKEIKSKVIEELVPCDTSGQTIEETGEGDMICKDTFSGRIFRSCETSVKEGIKYFKDSLKDNHYACYNNLYAYWGIECTKFGETYGWSDDEDHYPKPEDINLVTSIGYSEKYKQNILYIYFEDPDSQPDDRWMDH